MALKDTLNDITQGARVSRSRVDILLDDLKDSEDQEVLVSALNNLGITSASLTKAVRREYGKDAVSDSSVADWRRRHPANVNGL